MSGTRGSGVWSSTGDVFEMSVARGFGGVCDMCMCLARGGVGGERGEWMRGLGMGFTNPVGIGGVLDVCLCFGYGGVGGVGGECVGGVFVYGRYHKSRLVCLMLSNLNWSRHHSLM